ncbi:MAG: hypothetical protein ACREJ6_15680, partial [Candidatus Methylomirabilis sp.]
MPSDQLLQTLTSLCPGVDDEIVRDFVSRMDADYFGRFEPNEIARHIQLAARLDLDHPCQMAISERSDGLYDVVI